MAVPYAVNQGNFRVEVDEFDNVYYVSGQGGTLIFSRKLQSVIHAGVLTAYSGNSNVALQVSVLAVNLTTGTVGTVAPQTNGILIYAQEIADGIVREMPSGTIAKLILLEVGN